MFKLLYADTRKLIYHAGLRELVAAITVYLVGYTVMMKIVSHFMGGDISADDIHTCFASIATLLVSASTLMCTAGEYSDGCIRNKLISGAHRTEVFLSAEITAAMQAIILCAVAFTESVVLSLLCTKGGLISMTLSELADYWLIITMACISIAVFSTMLVMILGGKKISYVVGIAAAVGLNIFSLEIIDKLYPTQGKCTLSGMKLMLYSFYDRYVPYAYLSMRPHYGTLTYLGGSLGLVIISLIAGILIFNKKEIQ